MPFYPVLSHVSQTSQCCLYVPCVSIKLLSARCSSTMYILCAQCWTHNKWNKFTLPHQITLIRSSHVHRHLQSGIIPSGFQTKISFFLFRSCFTYALYNTRIVLELTTVATLHQEWGGGFTVKLIKLKLQDPSPSPFQGPGRGSNNVFI